MAWFLYDRDPSHERVNDSGENQKKRPSSYDQKKKKNTQKNVRS